MTIFRTKGRGRGRRVYPIRSGGIRGGNRNLRVIQERMRVSQDISNEVRKDTEKRMVNRVLAQVADIFLSPIFAHFLPFLGIVTRLFLFRGEQMDDELVIRRVEVLEKEIKTVNAELQGLIDSDSKAEETKVVIREISKAVRQDPINQKRYAKHMYSALLRSYASVVTENYYHSEISESGPKWRLYAVKYDVYEKIDEAIDCLVAQLLARKEDIQSDSDLGKVIINSLKLCLEPI